MTEDENSVRTIAERIARRVSHGSNASFQHDQEPENNVAAELSAVRGALTDLQKRLAHIESRLTHREEHYTSKEIPGEETPAFAPQSVMPSAPPSVHSPWLSGVYFSSVGHPSQERFDVEEATVSELVDFFESEKSCNLEPGNKPCDHCAMCSSRGF
jgi:hypothetical protein